MANLNPQFRAALAEIAEIIPRKVRTVVYAAAVGIALLAFATQRVVAVWWPELDARVDATAADVVAAALFIVGVLGFAYRPTRTDQPRPPAELDVLDAAHVQEAQARTIATLVGAGWPRDAAAAAVTEDGTLMDARRDA
ncbi:hypothetical protein [Promicromonospora sp. NPDC023805]|uniref:hypothetical protein n=1 Tax=Promicromonospora sp. NPDC023805 TaxID=3154696 RepID=UPI0033E158CB